ncbi:Transposable element tcb2 transposase [Caligus rogercresseyi]|uniref:Transposable element tcb2 transposase n=1 Tax=Caligus rogercresseyi TaxID=217165 RepID=A0A7T8KD05_CALRO|nr:Transposable element tcb2 transposase [Caligus rogercresseyi]QQP53625.1 Transposable element tcb2 transposase [Caligus rogercresseyi]
MTKLAAARDVGIYTISNAVREDLGYTSFTLRLKHLTENQKDARAARGKDMLNFIKSSSNPSLIFFSREKLFNLDRTHNRQNTRWICQDPENVPMPKNPASGMVVGGFATLLEGPEVDPSSPDLNPCNDYLWGGQRRRSARPATGTWTP